MKMKELFFSQTIMPMSSPHEDETFGRAYMLARPNLGIGARGK